jgi:hypothetical protein
MQDNQTMSKITLSDLNDKQRGMISADVRATLGKPAQTTAEAVAAADAKAENELQSEVAQYLRLHNIVLIRPDMRKRSPLPPGWPDVTFAYRGVPIGAECKTPTGKLRPEQDDMLKAMSANGWRVLIVRSVADLQRLFREIDAEKG